MTTYVHTTFQHIEQAREAVHKLLDAGFAARDISVLEHRGHQVKRVKLRHNTALAQGAAMGAAIGAAACTMIASLLANGVFSGPLSELLSSNVPLALLQGAALGAGVGAIGGGAIGITRWEEDPILSSDASRVVVGVQATTPRVEQASRVLKELGATEVMASTESIARERLRKTPATAHAS